MIGHSIGHSFHHACWTVSRSTDIPGSHTEASKFLLLPDEVTYQEGGGRLDHLHGEAPFGAHRRSAHLSNGPIIDKTNLPKWPTQICHLPPQEKAIFTGKQHEVWRCVGALTARRIVSLVGAPGVGKTTIATHACHYLWQRNQFCDGILWMKLQGISTLDGVVGLLGSRLACDVKCLLPLTGNKLLVLDNVEGVLENDCAAFMDWLNVINATWAGLTILITSRKILPQKNSSFDVEYIDVGKLELSDAVMLLVHLVPRIASKDAQRLAELCGNLPLALRLVGRSLANEVDLQPSEYIKKLEQHHGLDLLDYGACIGPSIACLDPLTRKSLQSLSIFEGSFSLPAAVAVLRTSENQSVESIEALIGQLLLLKLVEYDPSTKRYHLHTLIAHYLRQNYIDSFAQDDSSIQDRFVIHYMWKLLRIARILSSAQNERKERKRLTTYRVSDENLAKDKKIDNDSNSDDDDDEEELEMWGGKGSAEVAGLRMFDIDRGNIELALDLAGTTDAFVMMAQLGKQVFERRLSHERRIDIYERVMGLIMRSKKNIKKRSLSVTYISYPRYIIKRSATTSNLLKFSSLSCEEGLKQSPSEIFANNQIDDEIHNRTLVKVSHIFSNNIKNYISSLTLKNRQLQNLLIAGSVCRYIGKNQKQKCVYCCNAKSEGVIGVIGSYITHHWWVLNLTCENVLIDVLLRLAHSYRDVRKFIHAEKLVQKALNLAKFDEKIGNFLGKFERMQQLVVAELLLELAWLKVDLCDLISAESFLNKAHEIVVECGGRGGLHHAKHLFNLAVFYHEYKGDTRTAAPLYEQCLNIRFSNLGLHHLDTAETLSCIGHLFCARGQYVEAQKYILDSVTIREKILGSDDILIASSYTNLANVLEEQKEYHKAAKLYKRALSIKRQILPANHHRISETENNLAIIYSRLGMLDKSIELFRNCLKHLKKVLGIHHLNVAAIENNLASTLLSHAWTMNSLIQKAELEEAYHLLLHSLRSKSFNLGKDHPFVAPVLINLGRVRIQQGIADDAEDYMRRALSIVTRVNGPDSSFGEPVNDQYSDDVSHALVNWPYGTPPIHSNMTRILYFLGVSLYNQNKLREAYDSFLLSKWTIDMMCQKWQKKDEKFICPLESSDMQHLITCLKSARMSIPPTIFEKIPPDPPPSYSPSQKILPDPPPSFERIPLDPLVCKNTLNLTYNVYI
eukprot:GHVL01029460.1.p1 GENE.GHVL01029460.1~~GHVL01029460.1.p1  ORF type:complete len:1191 (-),score=230.05 GHVL01029460.1:53-3625(-)